MKYEFRDVDINISKMMKKPNKDFCLEQHVNILNWQKIYEENVYRNKLTYNQYIFNRKGILEYLYQELDKNRRTVDYMTNKGLGELGYLAEIRVNGEINKIIKHIEKARFHYLYVINNKRPLKVYKAKNYEVYNLIK